MVIYLKQLNLEDLGNEIFNEFLTLEDKYQKPLLEWLNNKNKKQEKSSR